MRFRTRGRQGAARHIHQAPIVLLFDQNTSRVDTGSGTVPAGQKFRLGSTTRDDTITQLRGLPTDAFLPVTS